MCGDTWTMSIQGIRGVVEAAIQRASHATGVDFTFLMKTAGRESGYDPRAKAQSSSAAGLFQFVEQTWLATLKQHGAKYGYARYAALINRGTDGRYYVQGAEARKAVMNLRMDPHAASLMAGELTSDHASYLRGRVGRAPTAGELYAAHVLGPQGSARLIEAVRSRPGASAASLFPEAAAANRSIFYRDGRAATVSEVYANLTSSAGGAARSVAAPQRAEGFIQYASARQQAVQPSQDAMINLILRGAKSDDDASSSMRMTGSLFTSEMLQALADARDKKS